MCWSRRTTAGRCRDWIKDGARLAAGVWGLLAYTGVIWWNGGKLDFVKDTLIPIEFEKLAHSCRRWLLAGGRAPGKLAKMAAFARIAAAVLFVRFLRFSVQNDLKQGLLIPAFCRRWPMGDTLHLIRFSFSILRQSTSTQNPNAIFIDQKIIGSFIGKPTGFQHI